MTWRQNDLKTKWPEDKMTWRQNDLKTKWPSINLIWNIFFRLRQKVMEPPWNPYCRGRLNTIGLQVLASLYQLIFKLKILFTFGLNPATLMRRWIVLSLPLQLVFPGATQTTFSHVSLSFFVFLGHIYNFLLSSQLTNRPSKLERLFPAGLSNPD